MRRSELVRRLEAVEGFARPDPRREQVITPSEAAADLLLAASARDDLEDRVVADLGAGTGRLAIGAGLLGARRILTVEADPVALERAVQNAERAGITLEAIAGPVEEFATAVDTVVMNPPFGAQLRGADRPFWAAAFRCARRRTYAFALAESRTFIARSCVERGVPIAETRPIRWTLPLTFRHHRKPRVALAVDLWVLGPAPSP